MAADDAITAKRVETAALLALGRARENEAVDGVGRAVDRREAPPADLQVDASWQRGQPATLVGPDDTVGEGIPGGR